MQFREATDRARKDPACIAVRKQEVDAIEASATARAVRTNLSTMPQMAAIPSPAAKKHRRGRLESGRVLGGASYSPGDQDCGMTETLTIPAHIENGSIRLDAPLPGDVERVEVRVTVRSGRPGGISSRIRYLESLPPGTRTRAEIDEEIREAG